MAAAAVAVGAAGMCDAPHGHPGVQLQLCPLPSSGNALWQHVLAACECSWPRAAGKRNRQRQFILQEASPGDEETPCWTCVADRQLRPSTGRLEVSMSLWLRLRNHAHPVEQTGAQAFCVIQDTSTLRLMIMQGRDECRVGHRYNSLRSVETVTVLCRVTLDCKLA